MKFSKNKHSFKRRIGGALFWYLFAIVMFVYWFVDSGPFKFTIQSYVRRLNGELIQAYEYQGPWFEILMIGLLCYITGIFIFVIILAIRENRKIKATGKEEEHITERGKLLLLFIYVLVVIPFLLGLYFIIINFILEGLSEWIGKVLILFLSLFFVGVVIFGYTKCFGTQQLKSVNEQEE